VPNRPVVTLSMINRWGRVAMVLDTAFPKNATVTRTPTRLRTADSNSACWAGRAREEMNVVMALVVS
jgi:hypothetical protein